jgi:uncharacterized protein YbjT (DUF2867 family)
MNILILGATGAAGGSLFDLSLESNLVTRVKTVTRRPLAAGSGKHVGYIHADFLDYGAVAEAFRELDACFFCIGRSIAQVRDEGEYRRLVLEYAVRAAQELRARSPEAVFHYLSGQGAGRSSRHLWARVKGEAEELLLARFGAVCWRPGAIDAKRTEGWPPFYRMIMPLMRHFFPSRRYYVRGEDLARAMLAVASTGARCRIIENREIRQIADASRN